MVSNNLSAMVSNIFSDMLLASVRSFGPATGGQTARSVFW